MSERETLVVAVSGGVDSAVLLDKLARKNTATLIVAHVDHGIREDSQEDAELTQKLAEKYGLTFETTMLKLGAGASEQEARQQRYAWLDGVREKYQASAVVTAHHQDDLLETIILNMQRGTGWRGLCSLRETKTRRRPLLTMTKAEMVAYAIENDLMWREDSTNDDVRYTRNYIRHGMMPKLSADVRRQLVALYESQCGVREKIEKEVETLRGIVEDEDGLSRYWLIMLPEIVALEVLRVVCGGQLLTQQLRQLLLFAKTAQVGAIHEAGAGVVVHATKSQIIVSTPRD